MNNSPMPTCRISTWTPNKHQARALDSNAPETLVASSGSGSGKTATLLMAAARKPNGLLLAGNSYSKHELTYQARDLLGPNHPVQIDHLEHVSPHNFRHQFDWIGIDDLHLAGVPDQYDELLARFPRAHIMTTAQINRLTPRWILQR